MLTGEFIWPFNRQEFNPTPARPNLGAGEKAKNKVVGARMRPYDLVFCENPLPRVLVHTLERTYGSRTMSSEVRARVPGMRLPSWRKERRTGVGPSTV